MMCSVVLLIVTSTCSVTSIMIDYTYAYAIMWLIAASYISLCLSIIVYICALTYSKESNTNSSFIMYCTIPELTAVGRLCVIYIVHVCCKKLSSEHQHTCTNTAAAASCCKSLQQRTNITKHHCEVHYIIMLNIKWTAYQCIRCTKYRMCLHPILLWTPLSYLCFRYINLWCPIRITKYINCTYIMYCVTVAAVAAANVVQCNSSAVLWAATHVLKRVVWVTAVRDVSSTNSTHSC
jgi:hypothetical protein